MTPPRTARALFACLAAGSLFVAACSDDEPDAEATTTLAGSSLGATDTTVADATATTVASVPGLYDIVGTALKGPTFTTLAGLVVDAGLIEALRAPGPITVFAPTNEAFAALPDGTLASVRADKDLLTTVLTYHVVPGKLPLADLQPGTLETLAGIDLTVTREGDTVLINGIEIAAGDVEATNGVVHVMSGVLVPPT
ncbi:MAG: fasciclin domain-containing protein [Acidimicrobiia bacterium]